LRAKKLSWLWNNLLNLDIFVGVFMIVSAIVLNVCDYRENDRIITCYTRELGKIEILVKSAKKINSKLAPLSSGLYSLVNLVIEPGKNFYHLIGGTIIKYYHHLIYDYEKNVQIGRILKTVDNIIKPAKPDDKIFDLLVKTLEKIDSAPKIKIENLIYAFLIKFLSFLGYRPEIKKCLICHQLLINNKNMTYNNFHDREKDYRLYFDFNKGGVICSKCLKKKEGQVEINFLILEILQNLLYQDLDFLIKKSFAVNDFKKAKNIIDKFLEWHLK
jgi:DNA repair protein RecO (recombination protein O)